MPNIGITTEYDEVNKSIRYYNIIFGKYDFSYDMEFDKIMKPQRRVNVPTNFESVRREQPRTAFDLATTTSSSSTPSIITRMKLAKITRNTNIIGLDYDTEGFAKVIELGLVAFMKLDNEPITKIDKNQLIFMISINRALDCCRTQQLQFVGRPIIRTMVEQFTQFYEFAGQMCGHSLFDPGLYVNQAQQYIDEYINIHVRCITQCNFPRINYYICTDNITYNPTTVYIDDLIEKHKDKIAGGILGLSVRAGCMPMSPECLKISYGILSEYLQKTIKGEYKIKVFGADENGQPNLSFDKVDLLPQQNDSHTVAILKDLENIDSYDEYVRQAIKKYRNTTGVIKETIEQYLLQNISAVSKSGLDVADIITKAKKLQYLSK